MTHEFRQPHAPARDAALKRIAGRAEELVDWAVQTAIAGVARNDAGPRRLTVRVAVPAPPAG